MSSTINDVGVVKKYYYKNTRNLDIRLKTWKKYGINKLSLNTWLMGLLNEYHDTKISVADIGCGKGDLITDIVSSFKIKEGVGVDVSQSMVEFCSKSIKRKRIFFIKGDITKIPLQTKKYDVVVCTHVLHHVKDLDSAIKELMRVTKKNGTILITTYDVDMNSGLNKLHYECLKELDFPKFMRDQESYLQFSGKNADEIIRKNCYCYTKYVYRNSLLFKESLPAIEYYASAMIYRNSKGPKDSRICKDEWSKLKNLMRKKMDLEIRRSELFISPGNVVCYKIRNVTQSEIEKNIRLVEEEHIRKTNSLKKTLTKDTKIKSSLMLPDFKKSNDLLKFFSTLKHSGYNGISVGLTGSWDHSYAKKLKSLLRSNNVEINAFHGTSIKKALKTGISYSQILKRDYGAVCILDPQNNRVINYDLYAGMETKLFKSFKKTRESNIREITNKLTIKNDELKIIKYIICEVAKIFKNRKVVFEIPGAKGWSMLPELNISSFRKIAILIKKNMPSAGICLDLGHLRTWAKNTDDFKKYFKFLSKISPQITMIHIASASSDSLKFQKLYVSVHGDGLPKWHIIGLDQMLSVDDPVFLDAINILRLHRKNSLIEVCETRYFGMMIKDYFENINYDFGYLRGYFREIRQQASILGYYNEKN